MSRLGGVSGDWVMAILVLIGLENGPEVSVWIARQGRGGGASMELLKGCKSSKFMEGRIAATLEALLEDSLTADPHIPGLRTPAAVVCHKIQSIARINFIRASKELQKPLACWRESVSDSGVW